MASKNNPPKSSGKATTSKGGSEPVSKGKSRDWKKPVSRGSCPVLGCTLSEGHGGDCNITPGSETTSW